MKKMASASAFDLKIQTLIFCDTETTGLPFQIGKRNVQIIELSLLAVDRVEFESRKENIRVINKLNLCFKPKCQISPGAGKLTGLNDTLLQFQETFEKSTELIKLFFKRLNRPICILAHNGNRFDFPLLKAEFNNSGMILPGLIFCADTLPAFRSILSKTNIQIESPSPKNEESDQFVCLTNAFTDLCLGNKYNYNKDHCGVNNNNVEFLKTSAPDKIRKGTTEIQLFSDKEKLCEKNIVRKQLFTNDPDIKQHIFVDVKTPPKIKSRRSYKLSSLYEYFFNCPQPDSHTAEADALALLKMTKKVNLQFLIWIEENKIPFETIKPLW